MEDGTGEQNSLCHESIELSNAFRPVMHSCRRSFSCRKEISCFATSLRFTQLPPFDTTSSSAAHTSAPCSTRTWPAPRDTSSPKFNHSPRHALRPRILYAHFTKTPTLTPASTHATHAIPKNPHPSPPQPPSPNTPPVPPPRPSMSWNQDNPPRPSRRGGMLVLFVVVV